MINLTANNMENFIKAENQTTTTTTTPILQHDIPTSRRRKRRRPEQLFCLASLFLATYYYDGAVGVVTSFVVMPSYSLRRPVSGWSLHQSSSSSSLVDLQSRTVKELRQMIKDSSPTMKLSQLKKKQDLIDYLLQQEQDTSLSSINGEDMSLVEHQERLRDTNMNGEEDTLVTSSKKQPLRSPVSMPPLNQTSAASPKDAIFEQVYQRYPPVRHQMTAKSTVLMTTTEESDESNQDVRQTYHPILAQNCNASSDMDVVFLGTASCTPGITRGVSCTALRLNWNRRAAFVIDSTGKKIGMDPSRPEVNNFQGGTWLFDVGECTQLQVQRTSAIKAGKITKIFLTHAHGDHTFGLPGLLCLMGQDRDRENAPPVEIYGPEGLRLWLRVAIRYSVSRIVPPYRVHEIMEVPMAPEWEFSNRARRYYYRGRKGGRPWGEQGLAGEDPLNWISQANRMPLERSFMYGEIEGGRDIYPIYNHPLSADGAPVWEVEDEEDVRVYAAPMSHGIPCLGYVVEESTRPGRLRNEYVEPIVKRNLAALKEAGFKIPMKAMAVIKNLEPDSAFTFPDGTVVSQEDAVEPPKDGRKFVYCGDTADCRALVNLAQNADLVIHECTNAYLPGVDKNTDLRSVTRDAVIHGHSTPQIAGHFCRKVNGKRLVLNHFSARYKGDTSVDSLSIMMRIEKQAMKASGLKENAVAAAWDLMCLPISHK